MERFQKELLKLVDKLSPGGKLKVAGAQEESLKEKIQALRQAVDKVGEERVAAVEKQEGKLDLMIEYNTQYFSSIDFVYVEKNLVQFKKAKAEQMDHNSKAIMSDDFVAVIERKLSIQLFANFKKCYNQKELKLLKYCLLKDLVGGEDAVTANGEPSSKMTYKKNIIIDVVKRIRQDMIVEDTYTTATENKKSFIEAMEKEIFQLSPKQLKAEVLAPLGNEAEEMIGRAKRTLQKHSDGVVEEKLEAKKLQDRLGDLRRFSLRTLFRLYRYNEGKLRCANFDAFRESIDPRAKYIESVFKKAEDPREKNAQKEIVVKYINAFQKKAGAVSKLAKDEERFFQMYIKGLLDRSRYW
ncbi:MAG: hypothetical protein HQL31_11900 [Planctomycetes bacterium]|nr:hypothetical protein [Planctomycetota bacterium]